jgi:hypothetical protein
MMAPAVLITLGVLFLLDNMHVREFHDTWPLLLIVIGIVKVLQYTAPTEGHIEYQQPPVYGQPPYGQPPATGPGGQAPPQDPNAGNQGVHNG